MPEIIFFQFYITKLKKLYINGVIRVVRINPKTEPNSNSVFGLVWFSILPQKKCNRTNETTRISLKVNLIQKIQGLYISKLGP